MILPPPLLYLHLYGSLVRLNVGATDAIIGMSELAHFQNPTIQRCPAQFQSRDPLQHRALPIQWKMIAMLVDDRVDHDAVTGQTLLNDSCGQRCGNHSLLFTRFRSYQWYLQSVVTLAELCGGSRADG